jgi:hypothetical protein
MHASASIHIESAEQRVTVLVRDCRTRGSNPPQKFPGAIMEISAVQFRANGASAAETGALASSKKSVSQRFIDSPV